MKESFITCPKCGGDACSEITNGVVTIFKVAKEAYKIINNKIINVKPIYQVN